MNGIAKQSLKRIFFALWPNEAERDALAVWLPPLKQPCKGRQMRKNSLHATLVFIGNVDSVQLEVASKVAREIRGQSFSLSWDRLNFWAHNHIVYAAPSFVPEALVRLAEDLRTRLVQNGFNVDKRAFQAHVTLVRNARCEKAVMPEMPSVVWNVREFFLVKSELTPDGSRYEIIERFTLCDI